jgi:hypothetical protein
MNARKVLIYVVLVVVAVNLAIVAVVFTGDNKPAKPLPNPNGYDDFVKAGQMIRPGYSYDYLQMTKEILVGYVESNEPALALVRQGLQKECRVPENYSAVTFGGSVMDLMQMKGLALDLCAEGRLKALQGKTNDAVSNYLDAIRFGQESSRGGVIIVKLVGIACETSGSKDLLSLIGGMDGIHCRETVNALETLDGKEEPVAENLEQEAKWNRAANSLRERIMDLFQYKTIHKEKEDFVKKFNENVLRRRRTAIDFAARAYELEKGKPPQSVTDLVPDYLKAVPKDRVTGKDLELGR